MNAFSRFCFCNLLLSRRYAKPHAAVLTIPQIMFAISSLVFFCLNQPTAQMRHSLYTHLSFQFPLFSGSAEWDLLGTYTTYQSQ